MRRLVLVISVGLLATTGCSRHHQGVRPDPVTIDRAANDEKPPPQRINNSESETVKNWSTGGP